MARTRGLLTAGDELAKLRNSIPPKDRCIACDGFGMISDNFLKTYRVCNVCKGTGRKASPLAA